MTVKQELYTEKKHYKNRASLEKAIGLKTLGNNVSEIVDNVRNELTVQVRPSARNARDCLKEKVILCYKSIVADRCEKLGLPTIPTISPKSLDDVRAFCKEHGTVIVKPVTGSSSMGFKEYQYRPIEEKELVEELELDPRFLPNQNEEQEGLTKEVIIQKFYPLDGKDSYHYSFKGWVDNGGTFHLCHSYREEWGVDPNYNKDKHDVLSYHNLSNALNPSATTFETDKAIDDEAVRQVSAFCKDGLDSCFMHGDAIVNGGKVYLIDMSATNNFATVISFCLEGKTKHQTFAITMPTTGDRKSQIALLSKYNGHSTYSPRINLNNLKYIYALFTGSSMKEIQDNREAYTKAIFNE